MGVITLTTEWRPDDIYSGIIKGKLFSYCPGAVVTDNACNIEPFNIPKAAFIIRNTFSNYPEGSIHLIFVHSEARKDDGYLIVRSRGHYFIGTDNGIFSLILNSDPDEVIRIDDGNPDNELDIFARAAAGLHSGRKPADLGVRIEKINERLPLRATIDKNVIIGSIIFIDSYGNAVSNITKEIFHRVSEKREFRIFVQSNKNFTDIISGHYSDVPVGEMLARFNSLDLLEISINGADISELFSLSVGSAVRIDIVDRTAPPNKLF
jgi:S-adenosyl-L-methionine hydrolase (adenosine-forming)